ncbi:MAG: TonB-dependent receptor [Calditrichaeota bacterium]|nr:TonB-dependent receptor [Calditrichota bacterium]
MKPKSASLMVIFLCFVLTPIFVFGGTTGKLTGKVVDAESGNPLPGANVFITGTSLGAAADINGVYFILNIPPGTYSVKASMMGYTAIVKENVKIIVDRTTEIEFKLKPTVISGQVVTVQAERPAVERDVTSKTSYLDFQTFQNMPVNEFSDAIAAQAGITTGEGGELHLRGGRQGEIAYMIDGVLVQDPFYKAGAAQIELDKYTIQEMQLITGAYNAEYGQAMSGIINIVTKEPQRKHFSGRVEYESHWLNASPFRQVDWMLNSDLVDIPSAQEDQYRDSWRQYISGNDTSSTPLPGDPLGTSFYQVPDFTAIPGVGNLPTLFGNPLLGYITTNLTGPVPFIPNLSFFVSARHSNFKDYRPWGYDARRELNGKLVYSKGNYNLKYNIHATRRYYKPYSHVWKYRPFALEDRQDITNRNLLEFTHTLSSKTFYTAKIYHYYHRFYRWNPNRKFKISDWPEEIRNDQVKMDSVINLYSDWEKGSTNSDGFYVRGDRGRYEDNRTTTLTFQLDMTSQVSRHHQIKSGLQAKRHTVWRDRWRYPWPGSAHYIEIFEHHPVEFAGYVQDKMEYARFIINAGLRLDYFDPKYTMWEDIYDPGHLDETTGEWIPALEEPANPQIHLSPRIGIAYPVTSGMVFHSSYGHFYEVPSFYEMYKHHDVTAGGVPLIGNPKIKSQKTVQYEFGLKYQLSEDWVFDVNAYFKDVTNLAASTFKLVFPYNFTVFDNSDYGSIKGIDFSLEKKYGSYFSGIFNYTLSIAKGNESSSRDGYNYYRGVDVTLRPNREYFLDFDRRHDISMNLIFKSPKDFGPTLIGYNPLGNIDVNILAQAASGLPYTPFVEEQAENIFVEKNTGRRPWTSTVDLRVQKEVNLYQNVRMNLFLVVKNLFNRLNTFYVWSRTGKAWDAGPTSSHTQDRIHNPSNVGPLRQISVGARVLF